MNGVLMVLLLFNGMILYVSLVIMVGWGGSFGLLYKGLVDGVVVNDFVFLLL